MTSQFEVFDDSDDSGPKRTNQPTPKPPKRKRGMTFDTEELAVLLLSCYYGSLRS